MFQPIRDVGALKLPWTRRRGGEPDEIDEPVQCLIIT